jgi:uncharacterized protein (DUF849 family)
MERNAMNSGNKLIINAAITGTVLNKSDTPHLPVSVDEIVECARQVRDAGASIVHLHARNADQSPSFDPALYDLIIKRVRAATDLIVCVSLSGRFVSDVNVRAAPLEAQPDMASLTLGSMNFMTQPSVNPPEVIRELAQRMQARNIVPELEVFEAGFINFSNYMIRKEILTPPFYCNILLGSLGAAPLDLTGLGHMVSLLDDRVTWAVGGLGQYQLDANVMSIAAGGHVRVGLEDNIYYDRERRDLANNTRLVERIVRIGREMGREPATPLEAREIIGLSARRTGDKS